MRAVHLLTVLTAYCWLCHGAEVCAQSDILERAQRYGLAKVVKVRSASLDTAARPAIPSARVSDTTFSGREGPVLRSPRAESEITAVMHPTDTSRMVMCAMQTDVTDSVRFLVYYTDDGGSSWRRSSFRPEDQLPGIFRLTVLSGDPVLAYDAAGRVHLTWLQTGLSEQGFFTLWHAVSMDDGRSWESEHVGESSAQALSTVTDKPWLVADTMPNSPYRGAVYLLTTELVPQTMDSVTYQIRLRRWHPDRGWDEETSLAVREQDLPFAHFAHAAIDRAGSIHVAVAGASEQDPFTAVYHTASRDGGLTFPTPNRVEYFDLGCFLQPEAPPCVEGIASERTTSSSYIYANPTTDELYAIWHSRGFRQAVTEGTDVYFSSSTDGGQTWSAASVVNQDDDTVTDNFLPTGTVSPDGTFTVTWYDQRVSVDSTHYYGATYDPVRGRFGSEFVISGRATHFTTVGERNAGFGVGEYNTTLSSHNCILPLWADGRGNDGNLEVYFAKIDRAGGVVSIKTIGERRVGLRLLRNPVFSVLPIALHPPPGARTRNAVVTVYDASGVLMLERSLPLTGGEVRMDVPTSGLRPGMYYLSVATDGGGLVTERFVKK